MMLHAIPFLFAAFTASSISAGLTVGEGEPCGFRSPGVRCLSSLTCVNGWCKGDSISIGEPNPPFDDPRPPFDDPRPPFDDPRPPFDDPRPPFDDPRPPFDDNHPRYAGPGEYCSSATRLRPAVWCEHGLQCVRNRCEYDDDRRGGGGGGFPRYGRLGDRCDPYMRDACEYGLVCMLEMRTKQYFTCVPKYRRGRE